MPEWVGKEVTGDRRYYNSSLAVHPLGVWQEEETLSRGVL